MAYPRLRLMTAAFTLLLAMPVAGQTQSKLAGTWTLVEGVKELAGKVEPIPESEHGRVFLVIKPDGSFYRTDELHHSFLDDLRNKGDKYVTPTSSLEVISSSYQSDRSELALAHDSGYQLTVEAILLDNGMLDYRSTVPSYGGADLLVKATLQRVDGEQPWEDDENLIATWKVDGGTPFSVDVSADGRFVVAGDLASRMAFLWDVQQGKRLRVFAGHLNDVAAVAISPDGKLIATGSRAIGRPTTDDQSLRIWDTSTGEQIQHIDAFSTVNSLEFSPDGESLLAAGVPPSESCGTRAGIWNIKSGERRSSFLSFRLVKSAVYVADRQAVLCLSNAIRDGQSIGVYDLGTGDETERLGPQYPEVDVVAVSPNGNRIMTCSQEPVIREWDTASGQELRSIPVDETWAVQIAYLPDGHRLITANESDNALHVWDLETGKQLAKLTGHRDHIYDMAVATNGQIIVTCSDDGTVKVWRVPS